MKAQYVWHKEDVQTGMIVCRSHHQKKPWFAEGWRAKWTHKIGFVPGDAGERGSNVGQYCLIAMTDGMVYARGHTKETMAKHLTNTDMVPMPWSWWLKMIRYLRTQTNPNERGRSENA